MSVEGIVAQRDSKTETQKMLENEKVKANLLQAADIATDFIPGVSETKDIISLGQNIGKGQYLAAGADAVALGLGAVPVVGDIARRAFKTFIKKDIAEAKKLLKDDKLIDKWKDDNPNPKPQKRNPDIQKAANDLLDGKITGKQYRSVVKENMPIKKINEVPKIPTFTEIVGSLTSNKSKKGILGLNKEIKDGTRVASRLDIPAYEKHDTWIVSVHNAKNKKGVEALDGDIIGYGKTAVLKNVEFKSFPAGAAKISAHREDKGTIARIFGNYVNAEPEEVAASAKKFLNDPEWTQIGYNPFRHGFFYNKSTGMPIKSAQEVIQVGPLVLAKNAKKFSISEAKQVGPKGGLRIREKGKTKVVFNQGGNVMNEDVMVAEKPKYDFSDENLVNLPPQILENFLAKKYGVDAYMRERSSVFDDSSRNEITDRESILTGPELEALSINFENQIKAIRQQQQNRLNNAKGGSIPQQMELFQEGGLKDEGNTVDPVSGNDVPPGSLQEEVRDDVPAQLSEGEFVFPADVVRFIGLEKLMMMRQEAKAGLARMEEMGQMGNSEEATLPDDIPFEMADLDTRDETEEDVLQANVGAFVPPKFPTNQPYNPNVNPYMPTGNVTTPYMPYQPGQSQQILKPAGGGTGQVETEMRRYVNKETGQVRMIPFNKATGTSLYPIDSLLQQGFIREDEKPKEATKTAVPTAKTKPVEESGGDDGDNRIKEENVKNYGIENPTVMSLGGDIDPKSGKLVSTLNNPIMQYSINVKPDGFAGTSIPFNMLKSIIGLATGKSMVGDKDIITLTPKGHPTVKVTFDGKEWKNILHDKTGKIKVSRKEVNERINKVAQRMINADRGTFGLTSAEDVEKQRKFQEGRSKKFIDSEGNVTTYDTDAEAQKAYETTPVSTQYGSGWDELGPAAPSTEISLQPPEEGGEIQDAYDDPLMKQGGLASKKKPKVKRMKKGGLASKK